MVRRESDLNRPRSALEKLVHGSLVMICVTAVLFAGDTAAAGPNADLQARIVEAAKDIDAAVVGQRLTSAHLLTGFYELGGHSPVWIQSGKMTAQGLALVSILGGAQAHGLDAKDYHLPVISAAIARGDTVVEESAADLELLLSDAALTFARHLSRGKVSPEQLYDSWKARPRTQDIVSILRQALSGDSGSLTQAFDMLAPRDPRYQQLKALLVELRNSIGAPLPQVPRTMLRLDDQGSAVVALRKRLAAWEGNPAEDGEPEFFDIALEARVKQFQHRHGLEPDGIVGANTIEWLNKTWAQRMRQVKVNLERWRWMPDDLGQRRIEVNIAGFRVDIMEGDRKVLSMRAIVGKPYHKTPVFSDRMSYLVLNPSWNIPWSIAVNEILPALRENPIYLSENNMRVLKGWGYDAEVIDPGGVDWNALTKKNFRYRFQQVPGDFNALGRVKFMFPNEFDVYLHDTSARSLFTSEARDFSHGCVRLEKPMDLAHYLLQTDPDWTPGRIQNVLASGQESEIPVRDQVPVHVMYWTVWVDGSGLPHFRNDIYDRDEPLAAALIDTVTPPQAQ